MIALLVLRDRRDEAEDVLSRVKREAESGRLSGFVETPVVELPTALTRIGAGDPRSAGKELAESVIQYRSRKSALQEGDYLAWFAAFRAEMGDLARAVELLEVAPVENGHIDWLVWPFVWKWDLDRFEELNAERRLWELSRMGTTTERGLACPSISPKR